LKKLYVLSFNLCVIVKILYSLRAIKVLVATHATQKFSVATHMQLNKIQLQLKCNWKILSCNPCATGKYNSIATGKFSVATHGQLKNSRLQLKCNWKILTYNPHITWKFSVATHMQVKKIQLHN
jgi:hypothetical protein